LQPKKMRNRNFRSKRNDDLLVAEVFQIVWFFVALRRLKPKTMSDYVEETLNFNGGNEGLDKEQERLNAHIKVHPVGERGQQMLNGQVSGYEDPNQPVRRNYGPPKQESWVDLHREYADIFDANTLQTYRRHFRALGESNGFLDANALHETMEAFFGQDLARQQILETISEIDYDNDGKLSYREFIECMCALKNGSKRTKFGNFYKVLTLKNPPFWNQRVGRANAV